MALPFRGEDGFAGGYFLAAAEFARAGRECKLRGLDTARTKFHRLKPALLVVKILELIPFGHSPGAVKTLAAFAAAVGTVGEKEQDPEFQQASALGSVDMIAATEGTVSFLGVHEHAECALHWEGMIAPDESVRNRLARRNFRSGNSEN